MKLRALKQLVDVAVAELADYEDEEVVVPLAVPSIGGRANVHITSGSSGFDWDKGRFFLHTLNPVILKPKKQ